MAKENLRQITKCMVCNALNTGKAIGGSDNWLRAGAQDPALKRIYDRWAQREEEGKIVYSHGYCNNSECVEEGERKAGLR